MHSNKQRVADARLPSKQVARLSRPKHTWWSKTSVCRLSQSKAHNEDSRAQPLLVAGISRSNTMRMQFSEVSDQNSPTASPPALVTRARKMPRSVLSLKNRTVPSASRPWAPPLWTLLQPVQRVSSPPFPPATRAGSELMGAVFASMAPIGLTHRPTKVRWRSGRTTIHTKTLKNQLCLWLTGWPD